ncbi:MAG: TadE/TadG family type IV pilus assembly protein [Candidatus Dormibacteria bacterium]
MKGSLRDVLRVANPLSWRRLTLATLVWTAGGLGLCALRFATVLQGAVCSDAGGTASFCRYQAINTARDLTIGPLAVIVVGALALGLAWLLTMSDRPPCPECGSAARDQRGGCRRCGFDPFASPPVGATGLTGSRSRGQSMVEFALVLPLFFFILFGIIEFSVLLFDVTTTRFAAGEGARVEAQAGDVSVKCATLTGCGALNNTNFTPNCDADCQALVAIRATALGGDKLEAVNYVDIQHMQVSGNSFKVFDAVSCQRYNLDGSLYSGSAGGCSGYPASGRNVTTGQMDYIQVNINFTYKWLTGMFSSIAASPTLDSKFIVRLEPQKF